MALPMTSANLLTVHLIHRTIAPSSSQSASFHQAASDDPAAGQYRIHFNVMNLSFAHAANMLTKSYLWKLWSPSDLPGGPQKGLLACAGLQWVPSRGPAASLQALFPSTTGMDRAGALPATCTAPGSPQTCSPCPHGWRCALKPPLAIFRGLLGSMGMQL